MLRPTPDRYAPLGRGFAALFALALAASAHGLDAVTVTLLDGGTLGCDDLVFTATAVTISTTSVALADCDSIQFAAKNLAAPAAPAGGRLGVTLVDGGWLPATAVNAASGNDALAVSGPLGDLELPLIAVLGWGSAPLAAGDRDQVVVASGKLEGRVQGIVAGKLVFQSDLDPKPLELALADVLDVRLAGAAKPARGLRLSASLDDRHPPLALVIGGTGSATGLRLACAPKVEVSVPTQGLTLRIDGGRRHYLSELDPASVDEVGAFGVVWPWRRDANLDGSPLRLGGVHYPRGVVVHSQARLTWKLVGAYERLRAVAGISDLVAGEGDCQVAILGDGKPLWNRDSIKGRDKPQAIDLALAGVQVLELKVDYGERYDIGDHFALADAFLVRSK